MVDGFHITNPKNSGVDLEITFTNPAGIRKNIQTLKPGETIHVDKPNAAIETVKRPPRFELLPDGKLIPDTRKGPVSLKAIM